jgi:hypothetical protein
MMDDPEVTIEPADNGYIVRHYERSTKKDEGGRTIRRVASSADEALEHAGKVLGGAGRMGKKRTSRGGGGGDGESEPASPSTLAGHSLHSSSSRARSARRRRPRIGGRR